MRSEPPHRSAHTPHRWGRTSLAALGIVLMGSTLSGCARSDLARVSYHDLPKSVQETVELRMADDASPGSTTMRIRSHATADDLSPWIVPIESRGDRWSVRGFIDHPGSAPDGRSLTVDIDTGAVFMLYLSARRAETLQPWIIAELAPEAGITAYGRRPRLHGLLSGFVMLNEARESVLSFRPALVSVGKDDHHERAMLGMGLLKAFDHVILDWPKKRMILADANARFDSGELRESLAELIGLVDEAWVWEELTLFTDQRVAKVMDAPVGFASISDRIFRGGLPIVVGEVAGVPRFMLLDTGFTGDLSDSSGSFTVPVAGFPRLRWARAFGQQGFMLRRQLDGELRFGSHTFTNLHVIQSSGWENLDAPLIVGMGVLGKLVMWLDHDAGVVRLGRPRESAATE